MSERETVTDIAKWVSAFDGASLPEAVIRQTKLLILDSLGCAFAALEEEEPRHVIHAVHSMGGKPECTVIGSADKTSVSNAVLANGTLVRFLDLNDFSVVTDADGGSTPCHPSDNIALALSVGEWQGSTGLEVIAAIVLGFDLYDRIHVIKDNKQPWDGTSSAGLVGAAMAGRLMKLDEQKLGHALGLAAARSMTPWIVRGGKISAAKFLSNPLVSHAAMTATILAANGVTGPLGVLDHPKGIGAFFTNSDASSLAMTDAKKFTIIDSNMKAYPSLATGQAVVAAGIQMHRKLGGRTDKIQSIELHMSDNPVVIRHQGDPDRRYPKSREAADHSLYFLPVVAMVDGKLTPRSYDNERWTQPAIAGLMNKVIQKTDPELTKKAPDGFPCILRVVTNDGQDHSVEVTHAPGFSNGGIKAEEVFEKFEAVTEGMLTNSQRREITDQVMKLDSLRSVSRLMTLLSLKRKSSSPAKSAKKKSKKEPAARRRATAKAKPTATAKSKRRKPKRAR